MRHLALLIVIPTLVFAQPKPPAAKPGPGDEMLRAYFKDEVRALEEKTLAALSSAEDWNAKHAEYRRQLADMLGLSPMPERTDLKATITGTLEHEQFTVEKLHFQSRPGLYVTGNLYIPKGLTKPAPTILYVCGHGNVKKDGISYGAKASYTHWPAWFARNGYVCLIIDTLQLGEIEGIHHGTYREKMWWWHDRGYTPAGVEAWNCIRALDYLETRPEVDKERLGVTGRSGGGAYSWWLATLDDRVKVAIPTAGITDLRNHVVDGCIEGHCDCMYMVNTYRWDFAMVAGLVSPRVLQIQNTDKDTIFPLDGVVRVHAPVAALYQQQKLEKSLGLVITEGPHKDNQDLQVPAFRWFNRHFKNEEGPVEMIATKLFEAEQLKVFKELPADQINTKIQETFVRRLSPPLPETAGDWEKLRAAWMERLSSKSFAGWPGDAGPLNLVERVPMKAGKHTIIVYEFDVQPHVKLHAAALVDEKNLPAKRAVLKVMEDAAFDQWVQTMRAANAAEKDASERPFGEDHTLVEDGACVVYFWPRGTGSNRWIEDEKKRTHILRRFALIGQTADGMRVLDVRRVIQAIRSRLPDAPLEVRGEGVAAGLALYAALFEKVERLELADLPASHVDGPHFLNVLKFMDVPQALAMAAGQGEVRVRAAESGAFEYAKTAAQRLGWKTLAIEKK